MLKDKGNCSVQVQNSGGLRHLMSILISNDLLTLLLFQVLIIIYMETVVIISLSGHFREHGKI